MSNSITQKIAEFLKKYEPFSFLNFEDLELIASSVKVIYLEKNKNLFQINDELHDNFYVMHSGVLHLTVVSDAEYSLLNKCHSGDIFGLRPFFAKNNYQMTAKAQQDCVIYAIPIETFKPFVSQNSKILDYLLESFANNTKNSSGKESLNKLIADNLVSTENTTDNSYFQTLSYSKTPLKVSKDTSIQEVASLMTNSLMESALITQNEMVIGIVTDADFRSKIATGKYKLEDSINKIMSYPVQTVAENISLAEAQLVMLTHGVNHLCVTEDGTDKTVSRGIISQNDLIVSQANNPGVLLKEIKNARNVTQLKQVHNSLTKIVQNSLLKNVPINHISAIVGELTLSIIRRLTELAILDLGSPPTNFALLSIGSQGRKEQLILTNHNNLLIFEEVVPEKYGEVKNYFLQLTKKVTARLEEIGYEHSAQGYVASNPEYCKSITDWTNQYNNWILTPGENSNENKTLFLDYELAFGDVNLENKLTEIIFKNTKNNSLFYDYLGNITLKNPSPVNFFKKFNLEDDTPNKGKFDIKSRALQPLIDAARMLVLNFEIKGINNTYLRFKQLALTDTENSEIYLQSAEDFLTLLKIRTMEGLKNDNSGQYINIDDFSKTEKEKLKNALVSMHDLESIIKSKFKLTQFS